MASSHLNHSTDSLLTDEILLNVCSFFEIFYDLSPQLFSWPPVSPQDWLHELSLHSMSPNLNFTVLQMLKICGIQSRDNGAKLQYLPNPQLEDLLFEECAHRQHQFILYCDTDDDFTRSLHPKHLSSDGNGNSSTSNKSDAPPTVQSEDGGDGEEMNDYGIPWDRVEYEQLPTGYKLSILQNLCDWIVSGNKAVRKLLNGNKKSLTMEPIFIDDDGSNYFLFGAHSLTQCLYRQRVGDDDDDDGARTVDGYEFADDDEMKENMGLHFQRFQLCGVGVEGVKEFTAKIDRSSQPELYEFFLSRLGAMELLEKKKQREMRRTKMRQQRFQREFAFETIETRYDDESGNRRSSRMRGKRKSYKEAVDSDGDEEVGDAEGTPQSELYEPEGERSAENAHPETTEEEPQETEPLFYPSGRPRRSCAGKRRVTPK